MKKLLIVDAQNQFMRSYIVNPTLSPNGDPMGGVVGFLQTLNKLCRQVRPDAFVVVWDGDGGSSKRKSKNKNYKAGRKPPKLNRWAQNMNPSEIHTNRIWQQVRCIEYVNETPILQFRQPGVEADDVISYVSSMPRFKEWTKVIVSSDKDFIQLLDERTLLVRPTQDEILNYKRVLEQYSIHPRNFAIARSMVGDKSDNIDGISGVGLKTVAKAFPFLAEDKDFYLSDIKDHAEKVESKLTIYPKVVAEYKKVCNNYSIMQLSTPLISVQCAQQINETFEEYEPLFNKTEINKMLSIDGLMSINIECLTTSFNSMVSNKIGFN
jgi:DNA polymerase-1